MSKIKIKKDLGFIKDLTMNATKGSAKYPVISECPVCHHDLKVVELQCSNCGTEIKGQFVLSKFNYLDTDKLYFISI